MDVLDRALAAGMRPRPTGGSRGVIVTIPPAEAGRKSTYKSLIDRHGNITKSGMYFYQKLNEDPPNRAFDPSQQAEREPLEGNLRASC